MPVLIEEDFIYDIVPYVGLRLGIRGRQSDAEAAIIEHHGHAECVVEDWVATRSFGLICRCDGIQKAWQIPLTVLMRMSVEHKGLLRACNRQNRQQQHHRLTYQKKYRASRKAEKVARKLLFRCLSKRQIKEFKHNRRIYVDYEQYRFRICLHSMLSHTFVYCEYNGEDVASYCIHFEESKIPIYDELLAVKLLIESDLAKFLKIANITQLVDVDYPGKTRTNLIQMPVQMAG